MQEPNKLEIKRKGASDQLGLATRVLCIWNAIACDLGCYNHN